MVADGSLSDAFWTSIVGEGPMKITEDLLEIPMDLLPMKGLLKEIPIIKHVINVWGVASSARDCFFIKKVITFLYNVGPIDPQIRLDFEKQLDSEKRQRLGEYVLVVIDKFEDTKKAAILAKLFRGHMLYLINLDGFRRLAYAVQNIFTDDLELLKNDTFDKVDASVLQIMHAYGLLRRVDATIDGNLESEDIYKYNRSNLGEAFIRLVYR